jgi:hypothetical protein
VIHPGVTHKIGHLFADSDKLSVHITILLSGQYLER